MEDNSDILTFAQIVDRLLSKENSALRDGGDYYQNLHAYVHLCSDIIGAIKNPKLSMKNQKNFLVK